MKNVTFIIPSRNTLEHLKWAYSSIRENANANHEIILLDDASDDGTDKWIKEVAATDENVTTHFNPGPERIGITKLYDLAAKMAKNEIIFVGHSDMIYGPAFLEKMIDHLEVGKVVCATRIEPPLHPPGPEKMIVNFGFDADQFEYQKFNKFVETQQAKPENQTVSGGMFAPWMLYKADYWKIGGHDHLFCPQSREDSDLFNRFVLQGYELIQARDAFVYHMTCRGSRYKDGIGKDSEEWKFTNYKAERNFNRKWGTSILHDQYLAPVIGNKYDKHVVLDFTNDELESQELYEALSIIEPWASKITIITENKELINETNAYIANEQKLTTYNMEERVSIQPEITKDWVAQDEHDIIFITTMKNFRTDNGVVIVALNNVLEQVTEPSSYSISNSLLVVKKLKRDHFKENIVAVND